MGLRVVASNGPEQITWFQGVIRFSGYALLSISILRILINPKCKFLHDEMANTKFVYNRQESK